MVFYQSLQEKVTKIKQMIGYDFSDSCLLVQAITHKSFMNETRMDCLRDNERLEFLGDSVLGLVVADFLNQEFPTAEEGGLSQMRSRLVDIDACAFYLEKLGISSYILLGKGEQKNAGQRKTSILGNAFEALIGAIFLDGGLPAARRFLEHHFFEEMRRLLKSSSPNYKARLQEYTQKHHQKAPLYRVVQEEGPDHAKTFFVSVYLDETLLGTGKGLSKKEAEKQAACAALTLLSKETG